MSNPEIKIRYANAFDNRLLAELGRETFYDTFAKDNTPANMAAYLAVAFSPEKQAAELDDSRSIFLIAEGAQKVVGYARLKRDSYADGVNAARPMEIVRLYARQDWIGHGVGAALMRACLDEAARYDCDMVWLDVWEENLRAIAFYQKWGFVQVGTQTFALGDDLQKDLILARPIDTFFDSSQRSDDDDQ